MLNMCGKSRSSNGHMWVLCKQLTYMTDKRVSMCVDWTVSVFPPFLSISLTHCFSSHMNLLIINVILHDYDTLLLFCNNELKLVLTRFIAHYELARLSPPLPLINTDTDK